MKKRGATGAANESRKSRAPAREKSRKSPKLSIEKDIAQDAEEAKGNGPSRNLPETVEARARIIQKMIATDPGVTYERIETFCRKAWGVSDRQIRNYWDRAFERLKSLGEGLDISLTRGRLVDTAFDIVHEARRGNLEKGIAPNPEVALSGMKFIASLLGLDRLAIERLRFDFERYERAMKIEEEKLRLVGGGADGPFDSDGFSEAMTAAAEKILSHGVFIDSDVVPSGDGKK